MAAAAGYNPGTTNKARIDMPFYEYECQACKFYTEVMQKISDAPLIKCPSCGKRKLKKLVSAPVFRLKGGGWYETDFKGDSENKRNLVGADKDEPKAESKSDAKADAKADAKPDARDAKPAAKEAKESKESKPAPEKSSAGKRVPTRNVRAKPKKSAGARKARR
jgi:putative FmdB family regulatory protein